MNDENSNALEEATRQGETPVALPIRIDADGYLCLQDIHELFGGIGKKSPAVFLSMQRTKEHIFIVSESAELGSKSPIKIVPGPPRITYACEAIATAYAMFVSVKVHLAVVRSVTGAWDDAHQQNPEVPSSEERMAESLLKFARASRHKPPVLVS